MKYSCVVIDDEPGSRGVLEKHIARHPALYLMKSFDESPKALSYLRKNRADIIFVDIEMPVISGIQLIESLNTEEQNFIFVTAYPQFALDAFNLGAAHYLIKIITYPKFSEAVKRILKRLENIPVETIALYDGKELIQIPLEYINWAKIDNYHLYIYGSKFANGVLVVRSSLTQLEEALPQDRFIKINRSLIVGLKYIVKMRNREVTLRDGNKFIIPKPRKWIVGFIENRLKMQ